jgi:hypothetical protein
MSALMQVEQSLPPITEFILKAIKNEVDSEDSIASLLGISKEVTINCLADMLSEGLVASSAASVEKSKLSLTQDGRTALVSCATQKSREEKYSFLLDGIVRHPRAFAPETLWRPRELESVGVPAIPFMPSKPPQVEDIQLPELNQYLKNEEFGLGSRKLKVLKILDIERRERLYARSLALAFKPTKHGKPFITFVLDGRISDIHEQAFQEKGGLERCEIFSDIKNHAHNLSADVERVKFEFRANTKSLTVADRSAAIKKSLFSLKDDDSKDPAKSAATFVETNHVLQEPGSAAEVDYLPVYEHPEKLRDALQNAKKRLLIISPWIRRNVVDRKFVLQLRESLERKVQVHIGYGLGDDHKAYDRDIRALDELKQLAEAFPNFTLRRLGDTHAKILIKDKEFSIVTSFNWLSFLGNRGRTFREEWGVLVRIPERIDSLYNELLRRF